MAYSNKPNSNNLPFRFTSSGYTAPNFNNIAFGFNLPRSSQTGNMKAAINVMQANYQDETYSYIKECKKFIIGYNVYGVQIIKGKCVYGGIRDLGVMITGYSFISDQKDLSAIIRGVVKRDLQGIIGGHYPKDLLATILGFTYSDLPAYLNPVPPRNLAAYLKPWPQRNLSGNIHGFDTEDLQGIIGTHLPKDLNGIIQVMQYGNIMARLKGWAREVIADLGGDIRGLTYEQLQAIIRCKYLSDLPAYISGVPVVNLPANIHGWQALDLQGIINGTYGDYDLQAYINASGNFKNLPAYLKSMIATEVPTNLPAYLYGYQSGNLGGVMNIIDGANLPAYIQSNIDLANLGAIITPKIVRLTALISFVTMEHKNLFAVINPLCGGSESRNLSAYLRTVYKSELFASITGHYLLERSKNLGARINYESNYLTLDKLPISITLHNNSYYVRDKLALQISLYKAARGLSARINGILIAKDLGATLTPSYLDPYNFENPKYKEIVRELRYNNIERSLQFVELSFRSIVRDMFYVSGSQEVIKMDRLDKWVLDVRSFLPADSKLRIKRRFKRFKYIHSLEDFKTLDDAIKHAIDFVTDNPIRYLNAYINPVGSYNNLTSSISGWYNSRSNLNTAITGIT